MERRRRVGIIQQGSREKHDVEISLKKVQVVYYLSRNGQLEHPHFMELYHHPRHHLKLKDVIDKLTVLRGRGMPSLFSWSCKRSYKNGYVWNDLSENDIIYPADGSEYILKGSELFHGSSSSAPRLFNNPKPMQTPNHYVEIIEEEEQEKRPGNHTHGEQNSKQQTELQLGDDSSPPSSSSSDPAAESAPSLNSVLRQLIVCGSGASGRKSGTVRIRGVSRLASTSANHGEEEDEIRCMSENPRFGNSQGEEKEYFSGSIVEAMAMSERSGTEPTLKKSSSCNEERYERVDSVAFFV
ncbi:hypothetical protein J5N97_005723 [Dioscorea zingiberensis]|uniref:SOSEKI DIX-like domain-containing protein n=1 Tax=Dioscorea zingiberensis TaxID=325984 RepID=A0A9D5DAC7_9LILI|nr:hypothetical protein J5N97_005723 [Dioscorea zingiberensis]